MQYLIFDVHTDDRVSLALWRSIELAMQQGRGPVTKERFASLYDKDSKRSALLVTDASLLTPEEQELLQPDLNWEGPAFVYPPLLGGPTGLGAVPEAPFDLKAALAGLSAGDVLELPGGVYTVPDKALTIPAATTVMAHPGARVIVTRSDGTCVRPKQGDGSRVEGIWFIGQRTPGDGVRIGATCGSHCLMYANFYVGYTDSFSEGEELGNQWLECVWMFAGEGSKHHGLYINDNADLVSTPMEGPHIIGNLFLAQLGGYALHLFHHPVFAHIERNFIHSHRMGIAAQGEGHLLTNNVIWRGRVQPYSDGQVFRGNLHGPYRHWMGASGAHFEDEISLGAGEVGVNPSSISALELERRTGYTVAEVDEAIQRLEEGFTAEIASIYANGTLEQDLQVVDAVRENWR